MFKLIVFQLNYYIAVQQSVIKYEVYEIVFIINNNAFLSCLKAEAVSKFKHEFLQVIYKGLF